MIADRVSTTCLRLHPSALAVNSNRFVCNMTVWREFTKRRNRHRGSLANTI
jgi:hypothetical protein